MSKRAPLYLTDKQVEEIMEALPHGSGIDCKWEHRISGLRDIFANSIHCMDENGYYDGYQDFQVCIFTCKKDVLNPLKGTMEGKTQVCWRKGDRDFKIEFTGQRRRKYIESWKEPLYEMIGFELGKFEIGRMRSEII